MKKILSIDLETYSDVDLGKCGVYAYVDSPDFEILLMAYSFDDEETKIVDLACGEYIPKEVIEAIFNDDITKTAFNANFERICLSTYFKKHFKPDSWVCTAVMASMLSLPQSLDKVGEVLRLKDRKIKEGRELIKYFCMPCTPGKINKGRNRNLPIHNMDKWNLFKEYCIRDVDVEKSIRKILEKFIIQGKIEKVKGAIERERELYNLDQKINDRGICVDIKLVKQARSFENTYKEIITRSAYEITGLQNPNSVSQLKKWFKDRGVNVDSLSKEKAQDLMKSSCGEVHEMLRLRLLMSKTSIKKYEAIERSVCSDGRVHGFLQFYGASRSGRWAGKLVQVQNLPQNHIKDLNTARSLVKNGTFDEVDMFYDSIPKVLSELIRTAFIPQKGCRFIVADFSAIEARVLAYVAGERWRLQVFNTHGKIYEASASAMFHVPIEDITKGSDLRQKGKISELALGYGGSCGALIAMGALKMGLSNNELKSLVSSWRKSNPSITKFWWDIGSAAINAVKNKTETRVGKITFTYSKGILFITLPSGRKLSYIKPKISFNTFGKDCLSYEGIGPNKKWERIDTYGPKLVENIVQAISRDILGEAMLSLDKAGFNIVIHVHDEVVLEVPYGIGSVEEVCSIMTKVPPWAVGLPLNADGYECSYYRKD